LESHSFQGLSAQFFTEGGQTALFGGAMVQFLPDGIALAQVSQVVSDAAAYVRTAAAATSTASGPSTIVFNFRTRHVVIDGKEYPVQ
jgi:hypothetical protein